MLRHRFLRFAVVGVIATAIHVSVFSLCIEILHIDPVPANALAFVIALLAGFTLNRRWTFAAHAAHARLWRYAVAALIGLGVNSVIMYGTTDVAHWSPYVGLVLALLVVPPLTFAMNQYWVFRPRA